MIIQVKHLEQCLARVSVCCSVVSDSLRPDDCSSLGSAIHGTFQATILEWVAISSSRGSSRPRDGTHTSCVSCIGRQILYQLHYPGSPITTMTMIIQIKDLEQCLAHSKHLISISD